MLVSFSVSNFRSFGQEETLNMVASNKLTDHPNHRIPIGTTGKHVLRSAVIYGANAAGKSNLVQAMSAAQRLILSADGRPLGIDPFRFDREMSAQPSSFEFRFLLGDRVFIYGFDVTAAQIFGEWLAVLKDGEELAIFQRDREGVAQIEEKAKRFFTEDTTLFKTLGLLSQLPLTGNQLFLSRVRSLPTESQGTTLCEIVRWLTQDLVILGAQYRTVDTLAHLFADHGLRELSSRFLQRVGTGVDNLEIAEAKLEPGLLDSFYRLYFQLAKNSATLRSSDILNRDMLNRLSSVTKLDSCVRFSDDNPDQLVKQELLAVHKAGNEEFSLPFSEESDGTQQLLHFMPLLSPSAQNKVFVVDELDRSLHPLLCWDLIRFFSESLPGGANN